MHANQPNTQHAGCKVCDKGADNQTRGLELLYMWPAGNAVMQHAACSWV
jgi:hypothetical protein